MFAKCKRRTTNVRKAKFNDNQLVFATAFSPVLRHLDFGRAWDQLLSSSAAQQAQLSNLRSLKLVLAYFNNPNIFLNTYRQKWPVV